MGDAKAGPVRLSFNPQLRVEFHGSTVTSDAGLLLPRELDEHLGLGALIERHLSDSRTGRNYQFPLPDLFRQSIYSRLAGTRTPTTLSGWPRPDVSDADLARAAGDQYRAHVHSALVRN
jgi:DDE family transposase